MSTSKGVALASFHNTNESIFGDFWRFKSIFEVNKQNSPFRTARYKWDIPTISDSSSFIVIATISTSEARFVEDRKSSTLTKELIQKFIVNPIKKLGVQVRYEVKLDTKKELFIRLKFPGKPIDGEIWEKIVEHEILLEEKFPNKEIHFYYKSY